MYSKHHQITRLPFERLANLYVLTNRLEDAQEIYGKLAELYPQENYTYQYALVLMRSSKYDQAEKVLSDLYSKYPDNLEVAYTYGLVLEIEKKLNEASHIYEKLYQKDPTNTKVIERLAGIYIDSKEYQKAHDILKKGLSIEPKSYQLNLLMGSLLNEEGRSEQALNYINTAIDLNPKDYRGYFLRAIVYDRLGQIISAEGDLKKALELNPGDPELLNHLGYSLLLWYGPARVKEAEKLILEALSKDKNNPAYMDSYAWVLYYKGDYKGAYEWLTKAYEKEKEDPVINEHIGDVLVKLGRKDEAKKYYERAMELLKSGKRGETGQEDRLKEKLKN